MDIHKTKDKETVKVTLQQGKLTDFWDLICQATEDSIQHLENELNGENIQDLPADEYKVQSEILKAKIKYLKQLIDLPDTIATGLDDPNEGNDDPDPDPYPKKKR